MAIGDSTIQKNQRAFQNVIERAFKRTILFDINYPEDESTEAFMKLAGKVAFLVNVQGNLIEKTDIEGRIKSLEEEKIVEQNRNDQRTIAKVMEQFGSKPRELENVQTLT